MSELHRWTPRKPPGPFVLPVRADPRGRTGPTPGAVRGPRWQRVGGGFHLPATVERGTAEQRVAEAAVRLPPGAALTGWAALRMQHGALFDGTARDGRTPLPVQVRVPPHCHPRPRPGVTFVAGPLEGVVAMWDIPCVDVRQALLDEMRSAADWREAVVAVDMAAAGELTSVERMTRYVGRRSWRGVPGVPQARTALAWADEQSRSPQETRFRLVWTQDAGLPRPLVNAPVFDRRSGLLGYPDLLDPVAGLVGEYDGDDHRTARRHSHDVDREAAFRQAGLEVTRVTSRDLREVDRLVRRLQDARRRALEQPTPRGWTLHPPAGFHLPRSLDERLDRRGVER